MEFLTQVLILIFSIIIGILGYFFLIRPIMAIGDIPDELSKLRKELEEIKDILKENQNEKRKYNNNTI